MCYWVIGWGFFCYLVYCEGLECEWDYWGWFVRFGIEVGVGFVEFEFVYLVVVGRFRCSVLFFVEIEIFVVVYFKEVVGLGN